MAKKSEFEKPVESQSESSGEEEEGEDASSEDIGSESEPEPELTQVSKKASPSTPAAHKKIQPPPAAKPQQQAASSSEEEGESGSESESESDGPDTQKSNIGARKPIPKPNAAEPSTPAKSTVAKRPADNKEADTKDAKKAKKKPEPETSEKKSNDDSKKLLFQRLWSEDDEIVILKGMIEYASKKKSDPVADLNAFHDFIKKNLHVDVTRTQLQDKIRRLKKKYENNKSKEKEGKDRSFSKTHEQRAYELSKSIWGNEAGKGNGGEKSFGSPKANGSSVVRKAAIKRAANAADNEEDKGSKSVVVVNDEGQKPSVGKIVGYSGSVEEKIMAAGSELFETGKGLEGETQWKKLRNDEMELYLKQLEVKTAQTRLVLDSLKSAEH